MQIFDRKTIGIPGATGDVTPAALAARDAALQAEADAEAARAAAIAARDQAEVFAGATQALQDEAIGTLVGIPGSKAWAGVEKAVGGHGFGGALAAFRARLTAAYFEPVRIVGLGSSFMLGSKETQEERGWFPLFIRALQAAYPTPTTSPAIRSESARFGTAPTLPGVYGFNAGQGGGTSANYIVTFEYDNVAALNPAAVVHAIGANDWAPGLIPPATFRTNVETAIDTIDSKVTKPTTHILVHTYRKNYAVASAAPWSEYRDALEAIANARTNVVFVNIEPPFIEVGIPGADPLDLLDADDVHQSDRGHAFMASTMLAALGFPQHLAAEKYDWKTDSALLFDFDAASLTPGAVASWTSSRGSVAGAAFSQATAASRPTAVANSLNGKPAVEFTDHWLDSTILGGAIPPHTVICVWESDQLGDRPIIGAIDATNYNTLTVTGGLITMRGGGSAAVLSGRAIDLNPHITGSATAQQWSALYVDGDAPVEGSVSTSDAGTALSRMRLGRTSGVATPFVGRIARIIGIGRRLTPAQFAAVRAELRQIYGI